MMLLAAMLKLGECCEEAQRRWCPSEMVLANVAGYLWVFPTLCSYGCEFLSPSAGVALWGDLHGSSTAQHKAEVVT